jgi:replication factor C subunit 3/5
MLDTEVAKFKVVILSEADQLSKQAQHGLRRTMEKYVGQCRIIMCCESLSKIIEPVRSRCLTIRVPAPSPDDISDVVTSVARKEGCQVSAALASNVARFSHGNLRRALLMIEACRVQAGVSTLGDDVQVQLPDWERYIALMAKELIKTQTPQSLLDARSKLYELLANCIPPELIFKTLVDELCRSLDDELKRKLVHWAAFYEARLVGAGQKPIYHLEAFVAKFLAMYKDYLVSMFE